MMNNAQLAITIIVAILGSSALTALVNGIVSRSKLKGEAEKVKAETESIIQETYNKLLDRLEEDRTELEAKLKRMRERESNYLGQVEDLRKIIAEMGKKNDALVLHNESLIKEIELLKAKLN